MHDQDFVPHTPGAEASRRPRLDDVAAHVGVSPALVSLVLRNKPGPSEETRRRVLEAAARLGYRPDRAASLLARRRSHVLGVLLEIRNAFHAELVDDLHEAAGERGYDLLLSTVTPSRDERTAIETLRDSRCEALILLGPRLSHGHLTKLGEQLPVVVLGRRMKPATVDVVRSSDDKGTEQAIDHLVHMGHRSITFLDGGMGTIASDRRRGYRKAMRRNGLEDNIRIHSGDFTESAGTSAARALLDENELPTAVVASNDRSALGLLDALGRAGIDVPGDISIAGYDDSTLARLAHVNLTTVSQKPNEQAQHAVSAAVDRLDNGRTRPTEVVLEPRLVIRNTTGPAKPR